jgi:hypothetical protein
MKKYILLLGVILFAFVFTSNTKDNKQSREKITICHIPPGNPENAHSIEIDIHAWPAHEAHGDVIGDCDAEDSNTIIDKEETISPL